MRIINSLPKYNAVVTSRYYTTQMNWVGNQYVVYKKIQSIQFSCPLCHQEAVFITETDDKGPWRVICSGCDKSLRLK